MKCYVETRHGMSHKEEDMTQYKGRIIVHVVPDLEELVPGFLQHRRNDIATIQEALKQSDFETIRIL